MAPSLVGTTTEVTTSSTYKLTFGKYKETDGTSIDRDVETGKKGNNAAKYLHYLPTWNPEERYPPLEPFEHYEHGKDADPSFPNLLPPGTSVTDLTPTIGSEVKGIQLSSLSDAGKDELALYVAQRKVVAFRNQDFADLPISEALHHGSYFGRHHIHPTSGVPEGYPEIQLVHRGEGDKAKEEMLRYHTTTVAWHSDATYEQQPPGTTFLYILNKPDTGGDTLFVDAVQAYRRLSPLFQERLHGLKATHSGIEQVNAAAIRASIKRREPVVNEHPIVRTHPATGEKALFVNDQFTREILGMKKEESDAILQFLYNHMAFGADFQARIKWEEGTVVVWDNRVTQHTALANWENGQRRHLARITPQAERPYETPFDG
ncbi:taurine catabolism dioxygenase tauD, tfdA family protein [Hirsutella rhossiliensis]|uniref:Taurine catabolism dioxygenase tauD, tfdA family domain-containing protein n=1 Tax=Hirsutella rhossiliensis TaxID=111463 RepID=A0A9P8MSH1_9HYPO|nr:taurine catabolism dioxygenase tauD, tfdA family domain-containing protein [Hirsutella rhossiliensis]KAH0961148.1 taurine catabolism dioxygenase tauD, tfdA family domain-containing protein [Hirsutella rhossiliensis]